MTDTAYIQGLINTQSAAGGGVVSLPPGNFCAPGLVMPPGPAIHLKGSGQNVTVLQSLDIDSHVLYFQPGSMYHKVSDLTIYGRNDPSTGTNAVVLPYGVVEPIFRDVTIWFGYSCIYACCIDGLFDNCYIGNSYHGAAITSQGANWYKRCKIDTLAAALVGGKPSPYYGFLQGSSIDGTIMENHFDMCDFSGDYDLSVMIDCGFNQAMTDFSGCVFSAPVLVRQARGTIIRGTELGGDVNNQYGAPMAMVGNFGVNGAVAAYNVTSQAGNMGVVFH